MPETTETRARRRKRDAPPSPELSPVLAALVAAFQHVTIGMAVGAPDGRLVDVNPAFSRMLRCDRIDSLDQEASFMAVVHPGDRGVHSTQWRRLATGETDSYQRENRYDCKDGSVLWGRITVSALRDDDGQFAGALAQIQDITAQKMAEAVAYENEARLTALVGQLPVALYRLEPGAFGVFHDVSPLFEHLTGFARGDLPASFDEFLELVHPEDRAAVRDVDERTGRTGEPAQIQYRIRGGDGEWHWIDNRTVLMRDEEGKPVAWHGAWLDVSAQVRLEASLRESETRFRRAFEDAAIGMSLGTPDDVCLDVNPAYCRIVGRSREALIERTFAEITHPDDVDAYQRQHARLYAGEVDAYEIEKRYARPDGTIVSGLLTVSAVRDDTGAHLYDIGQLQDITAQKTAQAALRENETRLRELVDHLPAALYRQDAPADGSATYVNPTFAALLGLDPADLPLGFPAFFDRIHPDDREFVKLAADAAERTGEPLDIEYRLQSQNGTWTWVHDRSVLERDDRGQPRTWTGILLDISERKRLEASLRESEAQLRILVEQLPVALYGIEPAPSHRLSYVSPQFGKLTGMSPADVDRGVPALYERIHPDDVGAVRAADLRSDETKLWPQIEYRVRNANGNWVWLLDRAVLARDEHGAPVAWHGVLLDISEQKLLEGSLRESEAHFRSIFEGAGIGMAVTSLESEIITANPALGRFLGYTPDELVDVHIADITFSDDLDAQDALRQRLHQGEIDAYQIEKRYRRKDGEIVWGLLNVTVVQNEHGTVTAAIGQVQDITARKTAEAALRDSEARFHSIFEGAGIGMALSAPEGTLLVANPALEKLLGYAPGGLEGLRVEDFSYAEDLEKQAEYLQRMRTGDLDAYQFEKRFVRKDGGIVWGLLNATAVKDERGAVTAVIGQVQDITARKEAALATENAFVAQQAAIAELERLNQSKSRFLSTISHEFRTPLTAIIGYSELLKDNRNDPALVAEDAAVIHREASRLNRMVDDVLLIDRGDAGHLSLRQEAVDVNALARDVVATVRPLTGGHQIALDLDAALPAVVGDRDRLAQALTNLVSNAVKYSPGGGTIAVVTRRHGEDMHLSVRDEGIGIAASNLPRIFERFERVETGIAGRIAGTGLGLSVAQEIAHGHGGRLWAESRLDCGSTFSIALPLTPRPPANTPPAPAPAPRRR
ncbi:MAG: PAS domain S-box protein [Chloroflexia bacterium]|nr:PAS domain S-box protein [Chloroflexia bacterium]